MKLYKMETSCISVDQEDDESLNDEHYDYNLYPDTQSVMWEEDKDANIAGSESENLYLEMNAGEQECDYVPNCEEEDWVTKQSGKKKCNSEDLELSTEILVDITRSSDKTREEKIGKDRMIDTRGADFMDPTIVTNKSPDTLAYGQNYSAERFKMRKWTDEDIEKAWTSIEEYLLDEISPGYIMDSLTKENILPANEIEAFKGKRREMADKVMKWMKNRLPNAFYFLLRVLSETGQHEMVKELDDIILSELTATVDIDIIDGGPSCIGVDMISEDSKDHTINAAGSNAKHFTFKMNLQKDKSTVHGVETEINEYINNLDKVLRFQLELVSSINCEIERSEINCVTIHLRPVSRYAYKKLADFCRKGELKTFVLNLLKEKEIFGSLPTGEMQIDVQVMCQEGSLSIDDTEESLMGFAKEMPSSDSERKEASYNHHAIKENLFVHYESVVDEIDPIFFEIAFVNRQIFDKQFFKCLRENHRKRRVRAFVFLRAVLEKGGTALLTLIDVLKEKGCKDLVDRLCFVDEQDVATEIHSKETGDFPIERDASGRPGPCTLIWSCRMTIDVKGKEADGALSSTVAFGRKHSSDDTEQEERGVQRFEIDSNDPVDTSFEPCVHPANDDLSRTVEFGRKYFSNGTRQEERVVPVVEIGLNDPVDTSLETLVYPDGALSSTVAFGRKHSSDDTDQEGREVHEFAIDSNDSMDTSFEPYVHPANDDLSSRIVEFGRKNSSDGTRQEERVVPVVEIGLNDPVDTSLETLVYPDDGMGTLPKTAKANRGDTSARVNHMLVLFRCLLTLLRDLNFDTVIIDITAKELLDSLTLRDIMEERVTTDKIRKLVRCIQQGDEHIYKQFKDCLYQTKQSDLINLLEKEEASILHQKEATRKEGRLQEKSKLLIRKYYREMKDRVRVDRVLDYLLQDVVLDWDDWDEIKNYPQPHGVDRLLQKLLRKCDSAFECFLIALRQTGLADLADKLETTEECTTENVQVLEWTGENLDEAWPAIEEYLVEELSPESIIVYFMENNTFSLDAYEFLFLCTYDRRKKSHEFLKQMKSRLPEAFSVLFHALEKTNQKPMVEELRKIIKVGSNAGARKRRDVQPACCDVTVEVAEETDFTKDGAVSKIPCFTWTLKTKKDGKPVHEVEYKINAMVNDIENVCLSKIKIISPTGCVIEESELGSVIIYLRPISRYAYQKMTDFCRSGGLRGFVLNLLKEEEIIASLPQGELGIEVHVASHQGESLFEGMDESKTVTKPLIYDGSDEIRQIGGNLENIRENVIVHFEAVVDEIDPLFFENIFVDRGILNKQFFKDLRETYRKRKLRAVVFLKKILEMGGSTLIDLIDALKEKGCGSLLEKLNSTEEDLLSRKLHSTVAITFEKPVLKATNVQPLAALMWSCSLTIMVKEKETSHSDPVLVCSTYPSHLKKDKKDYRHCEWYVYDKGYSTKSEPWQHLHHKDFRRYECDICDEGYSAKREQWQHLRHHKDFICYECNVCDEGYSAKREPWQHLDFRRYDCDVCDAGYSTQRELRQHLRHHKDFRRNECDFCDERFSTKRELRQPSYHHQEFTLYEIGGFEEIISKIREVDRFKTHQYEVCAARFSENSELEQHKRHHKGFTLYGSGGFKEIISKIGEVQRQKSKQYEICADRFSEHSELEKHKRHHKEFKPYQCDVCGKRFSLKSGMEQHKRHHKEFKPYQCDVCGKRFSLKSGMEQHKRHHTGSMALSKGNNEMQLGGQHGHHKDGKVEYLLE